MTDDTRKGSENEPGNGAGYEPSNEEVASHPRMIRMDELARQAEQRAIEEMNDPRLDHAPQSSTATEGIKPAPENAEEVVNPADIDQVGATMNDSALIDDPAKFRIRVKLDGQEEEMSLDQVLRGFQKESVATKRLNEATRKLKEADELLKSRKEKDPGDGNSGMVRAEETKAVVQEKAQEFINALLSGDDSSATELLSGLLEGREGATQINVDQIVNRAKTEIAVESALLKFQQDYRDIVDDEFLSSMANNFLKEEMANGNPVEIALTAAGNRAREWLKSKGVASDGDKTTTTETGDRSALKAGYENVPRLGTRAPAEPAVLQETTKDVVNQMRKARGLPV